MKRIFICSPYQGNNCSSGTEEHLRIAKALCKTIASDTVMPIAPHLYFPQFLDDSNPVQRQAGCMFSLALLRECAGMVVFVGCCGISAGMHAEIAEAKKMGIKYAYVREQESTIYDINSIIERLLTA